jgi:hypothetical protein
MDIKRLPIRQLQAFGGSKRGAFGECGPASSWWLIPIFEAGPSSHSSE